MSEYKTTYGTDEKQLYMSQKCLYVSKVCNCVFVEFMSN